MGFVLVERRQAAPMLPLGVASGVNNAVSRVAQLPVVAGLSSTSADVPAEDFSAGFTRAMLIAAGLAAAGAVIAATLIRDEVLTEQGDPDEEPTQDEDASPVRARRPDNEWHCGVDGAPLVAFRDPEGPAGATRAP